MAGILIIYSSTTGQTAKIADYLARRIRDQAHTVECLDVDSLPTDLRLETYEGIIIGAPVRMMKFPRSIVRFAKRNRALLNGTRTAFFAVCMAAADIRPEAQGQIQEWVGTFLRETGWTPKAQAVFAGALMYTKYDFITRMVMKKISASEGRSTDTSRDHEYTDWGAVTQFADDYLASVAGPESS